ncbi:MAG: HAMP domain-containing histidine kinase [Deltaproteobacteria bacterium]|nr:HAMP domain-containing histidine kinase [Deltaproteobacteria bacterium]
MVKKKTYSLKHFQSGRCFTVTAGNFDEAVNRTFDEDLLHWKCEAVEEVKGDFVCKLCGYPIDCEDSFITKTGKTPAKSSLVHCWCPICIDCDIYLGMGEERYEARPPDKPWYNGSYGGSYYCLKDAFKHGLVDNNPVLQKSQVSHPAEKRLKEWTEVVDQAVHDLKGALSFLGLYVNMFSEPKAEYASSGKDCRKIAQESFDKILELIMHLRDYARASELNYKGNDFADIVKRTIAELSPQAAQRGIEFHYAGPEHLVGIFDESKVGRVLTNLCINAMQAIEKPLGTIMISLLHNEHAVWIDVTDSGKGIAKKHLHKIFDKKFTHGKKDGTGLGLSFCKQTVEAHGGSIGVSSASGQGTTFSLVFPLSAVLLATKTVDPISQKPMLRAFLLDDECPQWEPWMQQWCEKYGQENVSLMDASSCLSEVAADEVTLDPFLH